MDSSSGNPTQVPSFNLQNYNSTDNLQMASISPSTYEQSPDGIYKPIPRQDSVTSPDGIYNGICKPIPDITLLILHYASANFWAL